MTLKRSRIDTTGMVLYLCSYVVQGGSNAEALDELIKCVAIRFKSISLSNYFILLYKRGSKFQVCI